MRNKNNLSAVEIGIPNRLPSESRGRNTVGQVIWLVWEKLIGSIMELRCDHSMSFGMCKVMVKQHSGESILCEDGTLVRRGDRIGELHLDNQMVLALTRKLGAERAALQTARLIRGSLREISDAMDTRQEMAGVKALIGVTLLHRGLSHGLGFEQRKLPSKRFEQISTLYMRLLLRCLHPDGSRRIRRNKEKLTPIMLICSRDGLKQKFNKQHKAETARLI